MAHTCVAGVLVAFSYGTLESKGAEDLTNETLFTKRAPLPAVRPARKGITQVWGLQKASTSNTVLKGFAWSNLPANLMMFSALCSAHLVAREVGKANSIKLLCQDITLVGLSTCFVAPNEPA